MAEPVNKPARKRKRSDSRIIAGETHWPAGRSAKFLGIAKNTLIRYSLIQKGQKKPLVSSLLMGKQRFYQKKWLDDFLEENTKFGGEAAK